MATSLTFPSESLTTISNHPTAFLPLPTSYPPQPACSSQIYLNKDNLSDLPTILAFDPYLVIISPGSASKCQPPEFTASHNQGSYASVAATTLLGGSGGFVCPGDYASVGTGPGLWGGVGGGGLEMVLCCPKQYGLATPFTTLNAPGSFPSQCTSYLTSGQVVTLPSCTSFKSCLQTTTTMTTSQIVYAWHVNGYNLVQTSTSTGSTGSTSAAGGAGAVKELFPGTVAGISIAATLVFIVMLIGALLFWRRKKQPRDVMESMHHHMHMEGVGGYSDKGQGERGGSYEMESPVRNMHVPEGSGAVGRHPRPIRDVYEMDAGALG